MAIDKRSTPSKTDKSARARSQRQARLEATREVQEEQAARERRQQTLIGVIATLIVVALLAVIGLVYWNTHKPVKHVSVQEAYQAVQKVSDKPSEATDKGGFVISKNGVAKPVKGAPTVEIYMDFMCPGCGALHRSLDSELISLVKAGQINLEIHLMSFMDPYSTDEYSSRTGTAATYIAQHDPDHLLAFIANLYKKDFQPDESNYKPVSNAKIKEQAVAAGITPGMADKALKGEYKAWLKALDTYTPLRKELWDTSGQAKGQMSTPTVVINGTYWPMENLDKAGLDYAAGLNKALGLTKDQVGREGVLPGIGATGKPKSLS